MSAYQLPIWVWPAAVLGVGAVVVWRGGDDERLAAAGQLVNWALSLVVFKARSGDIQWPILVVDTALLGLFLWIALRSRRFWPLFAAGFQLLAVITHLAMALDAKVSGWAYLTAELLWSYLILFTIGLAALTAPGRSPAPHPSVSGRGESTPEGHVR